MVQVLTKPDCVQCNATKNLLDKVGVEYEVIDMSKDKEALEKVIALGHMSAPVVIAGDDSWAGFNPEKIKALKENTEN